MKPDVIFIYCNYLAMVTWLLIITLPKWKWTSMISSTVIMAILAFLYAYLMATSWGDTEGGFGSLKEEQLLFSNDYALLAGWVLYLAFDLFLGS